jgi:hypothetical protein
LDLDVFEQPVSRDFIRKKAGHAKA